MREIKFRAWDRITNKLICEKFDILGEVAVFGMLRDYWESTAKEEPLSHKDSLDYLNDIIVEQYTGLKDKNGKEIYEGDTIEWLHAPGYEAGRASVVWNDVRGAWYIENGNIYDSLYNVYDYSSVIGNIHENPELLKEGRE